MATMLERMRKRKCYEVPIGDEKVFVRALTLGELQSLDSLSPEMTTPFAIGCALVDDAGNQEIPRLVGTPESNEEFAKRTLLELDDVTGDVIKAITEAIRKLNAAPTVETLVKNS
jgi:hypothetical protein